MDIKGRHRRKVVDTLVYSSVGIIIIAVISTLLGSSMRDIAVMYGAFVSMTSLIVVGHFATKPIKDKDEMG